MTGPIRTVKLEDDGVASIILGQSPPSSAYNQVGIGLPFFQGKADFGLVHPVPRTWCTGGQKFATAGDVLLSVRAPVGDANIATGDCAIGRGVAGIRAGSRTDPWFLYFALLHAKPELEGRATGSTFASVNKATLMDLEIPFPDEQAQFAIGLLLRRVVERLDQESHILSSAQTLKRVSLDSLVTKGLRGEDQKETEIGLVPNTWNIVALGSLGRVGNGSTPKRSIRKYWETGAYPWLTSAKVYDREITGAEQFVTDAALRECHLPQIEPGAILIAITGQGKTLGHCAVLAMQATINQHIAYVATDLTRADPSFIRGYLETQYESLRRVGSGGGSTKGALTCAFLRQLPIPLPPLDEQKEIVEVLDIIDKKIRLHRRKHAVLEALFTAILHKLMTGEIGVTDLDLLAIETKSDARVTAL